MRSIGGVFLLVGTTKAGAATVASLSAAEDAFRRTHARTASGQKYGTMPAKYDDDATNSLINACPSRFFAEY